MAVIPGSVRVGGFIAPSDSTDTYATQSEEWGRGGWRTVADITARNAITADRRKIGMLVRVFDGGTGTEKFYTLVGGIADGNWTEQNFGGSAPTNMATVSTAAVTYYVRSDGNDANDGLASDSGHSLLTIQAAINKLPQHINHAYVVDIGAGNFAGFGMTGRNVNIQGSLNITGALGQVTLGSGHRNSGTGGAGSDTFTLVDLSGVNDWTANELRGYLLYVPSRGEYRVIRNNTATTINCVGAFGATLNGLAYQIYEQKTIVNSVTPLLTSFCVIFLNNTAYRDSLYANNLRISTPSGKGGFLCKDCAPQFIRCRAGGTGGSGGAFLFQTISGEVKMSDCYSHDGSSGFNFFRCLGVSSVTRIYAYNFSLAGILCQMSLISSLTYAYSDNKDRKSSCRERV